MGYDFYRRNGICTRCGKKSSEQGSVLCADCAKYKKEDYNLCKDLKICVRCHKNPAEPRKVMCLECADKDSEQSKKNRRRNSEKQKKRDLDKYNRLKEMGICTYCKHEKAVTGKKNVRNALQRYGIRGTQRKQILNVRSVWHMGFAIYAARIRLWAVREFVRNAIRSE